MELKDRLKAIMEKEFGITSDDQLIEMYNKLDTSDFEIFIAGKGKENEI